MSIRFTLDPLGHVARLVKEWNPRKCRTEKDYERSLVRHLKAKLPKQDIVPQFGSGRARGDIVVGGKVLIEIKVNFNTTDKLNRLIGQLEGYETEWKKPVVVVLCGQTDIQLGNQLIKNMERREGMLAGYKYQIVVKGKKQ